MNTVICRICKDVVDEDFLGTHMNYVHGSTGGETYGHRSPLSKATPKPPRKKDRQGILAVRADQLTHAGSSEPQTRGQLVSRTSKRIEPARLQYADENGLAECVLCRQKFPAEQMPDHLAHDHQVDAYKRVKSYTGWIKVLQGGLPGLGKRS